jgi:hypothetical protein
MSRKGGNSPGHLPIRRLAYSISIEGSEILSSAQENALLVSSQIESCD